MILQEEINKNVYKSDFSDSEIKMSVTTDDSVLMMILSQNLYSDPISSIIRELSSNALDAAVEANNDEPIIVSLHTDNYSKVWFKVQDFGTGISPEKMVNVIAKFGESTKRNSSNQLGWYGLGLKSPFSYTDIFYITTISEGTEYHYSINKGETSPVISLLYDKPTQEGNGTTFSLVVKPSDKYNFINKIKEQLAYFDKVYIEIDNVHLKNVITEYGNGLFKTSSISNQNVFHICLNNVYYPIDYSKFGNSSAIQGNIGVVVNINEGVFPLPNRESFKYTQEVIKLLKEKLKVVYDHIYWTYVVPKLIDIEITDILNDVNNHIQELKLNFNFSSFIGIYNRVLNVKDFKPIHNNLDFYKGKFRNLINRTLTGKSELSFRILGGISSDNIGYNTIYFSEQSNYLSRRSCIRITEERYNLLTRNEKKYLKSNYNYHCLITSWEEKTSLKTYKKILNLGRSTRETWRDQIKEYQLFIKLIENTFIDFEDIIPSEQELKEMYRKERSERSPIDRASKTEIKCYTPYMNNRGDVSHSLVSKYLLSDLISKQDKIKKMIVFYHEPSYGEMFLKNSRVKAYHLNQTDFKKVQNLNLHYVKIMTEEVNNQEDNFINKDVQPFIDMVTAARIRQLFEAYPLQITNIHNYIGKINKLIPITYKVLYDFQYKNYSSMTNNVMTTILKFADNQNYVDLKMDYLIKDFESNMKDFEFLDNIRLGGKYGINIDPKTLEFSKQVYISNKLKNKKATKNNNYGEFKEELVQEGIIC